MPTLHVTILGLSMTYLLTNSATGLANTDRRRESRHRPSYLRFFSPLPGMVVDLSRQGMAIRTTLQMPVGKEVRFRVRHRSRLFTLNGVVRWSEIEETPTLPTNQSPAPVLLGIEFVEELAVDGLDFMTGNGSTPRG